MPINKVNFAGQTLIDLTQDTVTADKLLKGITAHDKAGNPISGTASGPKPEQEKEITITENGDYPIAPDVGKVLSKVLAKVNVSGGGGGGGFDPAPFSRIEVKTWTPADRTSTYTVTDDPEHIIALEIINTKLQPPGAPGIAKASLFIGHMVGDGWDGAIGKITDDIYDVVMEMAKTPNTVFLNADKYGGNCTFDRKTGVLDCSPKSGVFVPGDPYAVLTAWGLLK